MRPSRHPAPAWSAAVSDEALAERAQQGDREAFGALYDRHVGAVYGYCYRQLGDREAAQDAAAETFRKALAALPTYRPAAFRGWLFAIARHVVLDLRRQQRPTVPLERVPTLADPARSPEAAALEQATLAGVVALLAQLTPDQHDVIALRLADLTPSEISVALGKSRSAVDMLQHRALQRLRSWLAVTPDAAAGGRHG
jgi:RNA polymerase sigma-70 factor (ECF subfamily)